MVGLLQMGWPHQMFALTSCYVHQWQILEFSTKWIILFELVPFLCRINNLSKVLHLYICITTKSKGNVKELYVKHMLTHPQIYWYYILDKLVIAQDGQKKHTTICACINGIIT